MKRELIVRDERYYAVENASYRLGFVIMVFGTMILCAVRAALFQQTNWDFFALAIIASFAATIYQIRKNILPYTIKTIILLVVLVPLTAAAAGLLVFWLKNTLP